jgi:hypothetical protein
MAGIAWKVIAASQFPNGASQLQDAVAGEKVWVAVASEPFWFEISLF